MTTYQDLIHDSTPANKHLLKEFGAIRGLVASKIIYTCNLKDGVCRMGQRRKAEELGMDRSTVSKAEKFFIDEGYVSVEKEATKTEPPHLKPTEKLWNIVKTGDVITSEPLGGDDITSRGDLINQEEESKEDLKPLYNKANPPKNTKPQKTPKPPTIDELNPLSQGLLKLVELEPISLVNGTKLDFVGVMRMLKADNATPEQLDQFRVWYGDGIPNLKGVVENWTLFKAGKQPRHKQYQQQRGQQKNGHNKQRKPILTGEELEQYEKYERERIAKIDAEIARLQQQVSNP